MKANNGNKMNIVRVMALVLALVGVLTALPAQIAAMWRILSISRSGVTGEGLAGGTGNATLQFKYFAQDIYVEPSDDITYEYYTYDPSKPNCMGTAITLAEGATTPSADQLGTNSDVSFGTASVPLGTLTTAERCTCGHSYSWIGEKDKKCSTSQNQPSTNVTFTYSNYSTTYTYANGLIKGSDAISQTTATLTVNATSVGGATNVGNGTKSLYYMFEDGTELFGTLTYVVQITPASEASVDGSQCTHETATKTGGSLFNPTYSYTRCTAKHCKYRASATLSISASYTAYIRKSVSSYDTVLLSGLQQIKDSNDTDGVLYKTVGLSNKVAATPPDFETLKTVIPAVPASAKEGDTRLLYENLLYPIGYYTDVTLGTNGSRGTKISFPIKDLADGETLTVWVEWAVRNPSTSNKTDLNEEIADSGASVVISGASNLSGTVDVSGDFGYIPDYYENASGATSGALALTTPNIGCDLDLVINVNGSATTNVNATDGGSGSESQNVVANVAGANSTVPVDDNVRDFTVVLQQNTTITGSMEIAGHTGSVDNSKNYANGLIIGSYVALDLNGYTLTVANNGTLHSYGYIYDSVGTGKIVVQPGGTFYTQMIILGWTGGTSSFKAYASGFCPFEDYCFPYVHAPVEIVTTSSDSGRLVGFTMLYATASGTALGVIPYDEQIKSLYLPIFDVESAKPMFSTTLKSGQKGNITLTTSLLSKDLFKKDYDAIHNNGVDVKNEITFENVAVTFAPPQMPVSSDLPLVGTVNLNLDFMRTRFPVSPMLDITFCGCDVSINQQIMVMPGSTMTFDKNSVLKLGYIDQNETKFEITGNATTFIATDSKRLAGGIFALSYDLYGAQSSFNNGKNGLSFENESTYAGYWDVFGSASVNVYGTLQFQSGNHEEYVLSGNVNVSSFRVDLETAKTWTLDNLTAENLTSQNVALRTFGSITALGTMPRPGGTEFAADKVMVSHYFSLPLNSNGIWYMVNTTVDPTASEENMYQYVGAMSGTYDVETGQFTKQQAIGDFANDGYTKYIIDAQPYSNTVGDGLPTTHVILEFAPVILGVTTEVKAELVTASNGTTYVFYAGTYSPATVAADGKVTIDGKYYITGGASKTMTWSGTQWNAS